MFECSAHSQGHSTCHFSLVCPSPRRFSSHALDLSAHLPLPQALTQRTRADYSSCPSSSPPANRAKQNPGPFRLTPRHPPGPRGLRAGLLTSGTGGETSITGRRRGLGGGRSIEVDLRVQDTSHASSSRALVPAEAIRNAGPKPELDPKQSETRSQKVCKRSGSAKQHA